MMDKVSTKKPDPTFELRLICQQLTLSGRKSGHRMDLIGIGEHCLREICDRLDVFSLCDIAGTCKELQRIARESFACRKINKVIYDKFEHKTMKANEFCAANYSELANILMAFGDMITDISVPFYEANGDANTMIFNEVVRRCSGTLRKLDYYYISGGFNVEEMLDSQLLFANLKQLGLGECQGFKGKIPFDACEQLSVIRIFLDDWDESPEFFSATFPNLKCFLLESGSGCVTQDVFESFLGRHRQLTDLKLNMHDDIDLAVLNELPDLRVTEIESMTSRMMPPLSLKHQKRLRLIKFGAFGNSSMEFIDRWTQQESLEELDLSKQIFIDESVVWRNLNKLKELRVLKMKSNRTDHLLAETIEALVGNLPLLEKIEIHCTYKYGKCMIGAYRYLGTVCQRRNISVDIEVTRKRMNKRDAARVQVVKENCGYITFRIGKLN